MDINKRQLCVSFFCARLCVRIFCNPSKSSSPYVPINQYKILNFFGIFCYFARCIMYHFLQTARPVSEIEAFLSDYILMPTSNPSSIASLSDSERTDLTKICRTIFRLSAKRDKCLLFKDCFLEAHPACIFIKRFTTAHQTIRRKIPVRISDGNGDDNILIFWYMHNFS